MTADLQYFNFESVRLTQDSAAAPANPAPAAPPTVSITSPAAGATVSGVMQVTASASSSIGIAGVQFNLDGAALGAEVTTAPYAVSWDTTHATNGTHNLTAVARDTTGTITASAADQVTVSNAVPDTTSPSVSITSPTAGSTVNGAVQVTAGASDNVGVASVQFYLDGAPLGTQSLTTPFTVSWTTTGSANGSHTLTAVARDAAGNTATSAAVQVMVSNTTTSSGLTATVTSPLSGATLNGTLQVSATAWSSAVGVRFYVDGNQIGIEDNFAPFSVSWDTTTSKDGSHTLTAVARDLVGNLVTSAPVTVTVSNTVRKRVGRH
jgi:hypothetical protein